MNTLLKPGLQQGVHAAKEALSDAEIEWKDIEFAYGGSSAAGSADTMVSELGLTGVPFMNVSNGCATGGSALLSAYTTIKSGQFDIGMAVGFDKHPWMFIKTNSHTNVELTRFDSCVC